MYEYGIIARTVNLNLEALSTATADRLTLDLGVGLKETVDQVSEGMKSFEGGDWEIISHQLTRIDHHLLISFLLRRPK